MNSHRADSAVAFVREVSADPAREADARRATSLLYHATSAAPVAMSDAAALVLHET